MELPGTGERPKLYANQLRDDLRLIFKKAIDRGKKSITVFIYTITDPIIISSLKKKAGEGVNVQVVTDVKTARGLERRLGNKIHLIKRFGPGLMHRKIIVIDGDQTWIGSANLTKESLHMHGNLVIGFEDPSLSKMIDESVKGNVIPYSKYRIGGQEVEVSFVPEDTESLQRLLSLINTAKKSVKIAMFTWTRRDLAEAVIQAKDRGLDVEVVLDNQQSKGDSGKIFRMLKENGVNVRLSRGPGLLHHKFLYIDGDLLVNGSANWTSAAFKKNEDVYVILHNLDEEQHNKMEKLWKVIQIESFQKNGT